MLALGFNMMDGVFSQRLHMRFRRESLIILDGPMFHVIVEWWLTGHMGPQRWLRGWTLDSQACGPSWDPRTHVTNRVLTYTRNSTFEGGIDRRITWARWLSVEPRKQEPRFRERSPWVVEEATQCPILASEHMHGYSHHKHKCMHTHT